jgi:uncharacterized protein YggE
MNLLKGGAIAVLVLVLAILVGVGRPEGAKGGSAESLHGITVTGTGEVKTIPDRAGFTFGVEARRKDAAGALAANGRQMRELVSALKNAGVPERELQTTSVSLWPDYDDSGSDRVGYVASSSVSVTVPIADAGRVVDAASGAGVDEVDGPSLAKADSDALADAALRAAVADARERAQALAAAAGVELGAVVSVEEQNDGATPFYADTAAAPMRASGQVEPGTQRVEASVSVTFAIA